MRKWKLKGKWLAQEQISTDNINSPSILFSLPLLPLNFCWALGPETWPLPKCHCLFPTCLCSVPWAVVFSLIILSGSEDGKIHVWNGESGIKVAVLDGKHTGPITCLQFNPKFMTFASACSNMVCEPMGNVLHLAALSVAFEHSKLYSK